MSIAHEKVLTIVESLYGMTGKLSNLGSCQDINLKFSDSASACQYVVKFTDSASCTEREINFQHAVITFLQSCTEVEVALPLPLPNTHGKLVASVDIDGAPYFVRMLKFVRGNILSDYKYFSDDVLQAFGAFVGRLTLSMVDFPAYVAGEPELLAVADREIEWDLRRAQVVIDGFLPAFVGSEDEAAVNRRATLLSLYSEAKAALDKCTVPMPDGSEPLRTQVLHGDLAHYNVVAQTDASGRPYVTGVIDFGDAMRSWTVAELAVAVVSGLAAKNVDGNTILETCAVLRGFHSVYPLNEREVMALWPLVILRSLVNILCIRNELEKDPGNQYNIDGLAAEWHIFDRIAAVPLRVAQEALRWAADLIPSSTVAASGWTLFDPRHVDLVPIDLRVESPLFADGNWTTGVHAGKGGDRSEDPVRALVEAAEVVFKGPEVVGFACPYGVGLMHRSAVNTLTEPDAVALGARILFRSTAGTGTPAWLRIPASFTLDSTAFVGDEFQAVFLPTPGVKLTISCPRSGLCIPDPEDAIARQLGGADYELAVRNNSEVFVQVSLLPTLETIPQYCSASMFAVWQRICPSPHKLFHLPEVEGVDDAITECERQAAAVKQRGQHVAAVQEHYFRQPPRIERGWRQHLYSPNGRGYLDMVNNVAVLGHCHPAVTSAATAQMRLLNTNSRFVYKQLSTFADKIIATMPANAPNLNAVFFVNSGSEATDLAMRIARTVATYHHKQRLLSEHGAAGNSAAVGLCRDTICLEGGYHGVTTASDEVSTTLNDNPHALSSRPPWIHLVPMPNPLRGRFPYSPAAAGERSAGERYADFVTETIAGLKGKGTFPACFIAEPLSGNAGGVELPPGYLQRVYAEVRAAGGLCIADEVQVGYGRLGTHFWAHQEHGVVPDILTMAKAAGNGHPLGFVVTSKENAAIFGAESGSFFSSAGGGPVSCAIGSAVLDTVVAEGLQVNAAEVGAYLHDKLQQLAARQRHIVGCIHGHGLYQGIELVRGEANILTPSADTSTAVGSRRGPTPATAEAYAICERLLSLGVICHNTGDYSNVLKVKPPLCFSRQDADFFVQALDIALQGW